MAQGEARMLPVFDGRCWQGFGRSPFNWDTIVEPWPSEAGREWYSFAVTDGMTLVSLKRGAKSSYVPKSVGRLLENEHQLEYKAIDWREVKKEDLWLPEMICN